MKEAVFKDRLRQAHATATHGAQAIVGALASYEPEFMSVILGEVDGAATRLEAAARQLRDAAVLARAEHAPAKERA